MKHASIVCAAILALQGASLAGGEGWTSDYQAAQKQAAESKKDLLIDFTGSDWCIWCKRLDKEVFEEADFQKEIVKGYVLVKLDFPQDQSLVTEEIKAQNAQLQEQYKVQGFPTIFLMDASGKPFAQTGYQPGGGAKYLEHVAELSKGKAGYDENMAKAKDAKGVDRAKLLKSPCAAGVAGSEHQPDECSYTCNHER